MMTINELLTHAKSEIVNLGIGETFLLKDLFKGYEWKRINQGDRSTLGTLFLNYVNSSESGERIEIITKSTGVREYRIKR